MSSEYLVQHGLGGFIGRFRCSGDDAFSRGTSVVVRTRRGLEIGVILGAASYRLPTALESFPAGELLRETSEADLRCSLALEAKTRQILDDARQRAEEQQYPLTILDGEILLDGATAVLQAVCWGECDATPLFEELSTRHDLVVTLHDLTASKTEALGGCGKEGCGSGGCGSCGASAGGGCSTGSCSSGKVKSAAEMSAYFLGLRKQMESKSRKVPLATDS